MEKYTFTQARQNFASVLKKVKTDGEVIIQKRNGSTFIIKSYHPNKSPLNVKGIDVDVSSSEIVDIIQETRRR
ncbi:MAG: type II toxin-antitoxin system Phd/YefM family antitoxin [bacterium]